MRRALTRSTPGGSPISSSPSVRDALTLDITVDGVPMRVHLIEGANVDPVEKNEGGEDAGEVTLHAANGGVYAFVGGRQAFVELVDPFARPEAGAEEGDSAIRAPMNGRLVAIAVEEGDTVEAGQRLAVVEAMKMEHALVAPYAGVVRDLTAAVGEQVEMGERIMWVEKEGERGEGDGQAKGSDRPTGRGQAPAPAARVAQIRASKRQ